MPPTRRKFGLTTLDPRDDLDGGSWTESAGSADEQPIVGLPDPDDISAEEPLDVALERLEKPWRGRSTEG